MVFFTILLRFSKSGGKKHFLISNCVVEKPLTYRHQSRQSKSTLSPTPLHSGFTTELEPVISSLWESHQEQRLQCSEAPLLSIQRHFSRCFSSRCFQTDFGNGNSSKELSEETHKSKIFQVELPVGNNLVSFSWRSQPYLDPWCNSKESED